MHLNKQLAWWQFSVRLWLYLEAFFISVLRGKTHPIVYIIIHNPLVLTVFSGAKCIVKCLFKPKHKCFY